MGRNSHLTSSHWVGPIIICSFGPHQPSLISHTAPRWPSLSNSAQFSFNYDSADLKKYCCLLSKTLNCHSPKDCFLTGNKCPEEVFPCVSHTRAAARVRGEIFFFHFFFPRLSSVSLVDGEMFISRVFLPCGEGISFCVICALANGLRNQSERSSHTRSKCVVAVKSIVSCFLGIWFEEITLCLVDKWQSSFFSLPEVPGLSQSKEKICFV